MQNAISKPCLLEEEAGISNNPREMQALRESEDKFSRAFRLSPDSININRLTDGVYLDVNEGFTTITGFSRDDVLGRSSVSPELNIWVNPQDRERLVAGLKSNGEVHSLESQFRCKDGQVKTGLMSARIMTINNEVCILSITRDISDRKRVEEALRESEAKFKAIFEGSNDAIVLLDEKGFFDCNRCALQMFGYENKDLIIGRHPADISPPVQPMGVDSRSMSEEYIRMANEKGGCRFDWIHRRADGSEFPSEVALAAFEYGGKKVLQATVQNITERKRTEEAIQASLAEKIVLLKEVHHRVKNNLQIIISLLNLQAHRIHNAEALDILKSTSSRVRSMALLHETLYRSDNLARVNVSAYVKEIVSHIMRAYGVTAGRIKLEHQIQGVSLELDQSVPCGLIINELVSNALKYAFPGERPGCITVKMHMKENRQVELVVSDNGVGLPPELNVQKTKTLGLVLVTILTKQLQGTLEVNRQSGSTFRIEFRADHSPAGETKKS